MTLAAALHGDMDVRTVSEHLGRPKSQVSTNTWYTLDMVTRGKSVADLAYAAGIIDGEGSICMRRVKRRKPAVSLVYVVSVDVGTTTPVLTEWLIRTFGGSTYMAKPTQPQYQLVSRWNLSAALAADFLREVFPYLKIKHRQAALAIGFQEQRKDFRGGPYKGQRKPVEPEELAWRDLMYERMKALNARPQRLSETASDADEATV